MTEPKYAEPGWYVIYNPHSHMKLSAPAHWMSGDELTEFYEIQERLQLPKILYPVPEMTRDLGEPK